MKQQKIYEFSIDRPLTPARRRVVEKHIEQNAHLSPRPISYAWDEVDDEVLRITADPVEVEIKFQRKTVQLFAAAPLWARMLFTKQRKAELKEEIESALKKAKFIGAGKPRKSATRKRQKSAPGKFKKAPAKSRNRSAARA